MTATSGVRSSWLIIARKADFARSAASASSRARRRSASSALRSVTSATNPYNSADPSGFLTVSAWPCIHATSPSGVWMRYSCAHGRPLRAALNMVSNQPPRSSGSTTRAIPGKSPSWLRASRWIEPWRLVKRTLKPPSASMWNWKTAPGTRSAIVCRRFSASRASRSAIRRPARSFSIASAISLKSPASWVSSATPWGSARWDQSPSVIRRVTSARRESGRTIERAATTSAAARTAASRTRIAVWTASSRSVLPWRSWARRAVRASTSAVKRSIASMILRFWAW